VTNVSKWVVHSGATRHICATKDAFTSYTTMGDGEELVYLGDSQTAAVLGKSKVMLKLTPGKTLALSDVSLSHFQFFVGYTTYHIISLVSSESSACRKGSVISWKG